MKPSTFEKYKLVVDEWFVNGFNGTKAYQKFYPEASDETAAVKFSELVRIGKVSEYKQQKMQEAGEKLNITLETQLLELEELKLLTKEDNRFRETISVIQEQNKLKALYEAHNRQKSERTVLTNEERLNRIKELSKKVK